MTSLLGLAESIWKNTIEIKFGDEQVWNQDSLKHVWFKEHNLANKWTGQASGWYWFICETDFDELQKLKRPSSLPRKGCNFSSLSSQNMKIFPKEILCLPSNNELIIYNGHEGRVTSRIRAHFSLNNNSTGALGIIHYPLSTKKWKVRFFTSQQVKNLPLGDRDAVNSLIGSKSGRAAIENAWRMNRGWPILCKQ